MKNCVISATRSWVMDQAQRGGSMMQSIASFDLYGHDLTTLARESVFSCESETFLTTVERLHLCARGV